jgi:hypothetical protein
MTNLKKKKDKDAFSLEKREKKEEREKKMTSDKKPIIKC